MPTTGTPAPSQPSALRRYIQRATVLDARFWLEGGVLNGKPVPRDSYLITTRQGNGQDEVTIVDRSKFEAFYRPLDEE
jgi:hypothetical protein